jgi:hypothetical protein
VRLVRILGLCLVAAFAITVVSASSALAIKNPSKSVKVFENCPVNGEAEVGPGEFEKDDLCVFGATEPNEGGQFTVGPITVPIVKQISLQYGLTYDAKVPNERGYVYIPPAHGAPAITPTPEPVPGEPIASITPAEQEELGWPESLKYSYAQAQKHHAVKKVYEAIEQAGNPATSVTNLLSEQGTAVEAPVKIKGENKWLSELGVVCYIGSNEEPIVQHLKSGESESPLTHTVIHGDRGELVVLHEGKEVLLTHSNLVDNTYPVPGASCSGPYSGVIAATIDKEFDIPQPAGASVTEIKGTLYNAVPALLE